MLLFKSVPWILGASALTLLYLLFSERLLPARTVEVESVVTVPEIDRRPGEGRQKMEQSGSVLPYSGGVLFQASGWFEADPFSYRATALATGVVEAVHVLEGEMVASGQPIASMIREDAELRVRAVQSSLEAAKAALSTAESEFDLALARRETMQRQIAVAGSRREELSDLAIRAEELGDQVISKQDIIQSRLRLKTQEQTVEAMQAQLSERGIEVKQLEAQVRLREALLAEAESRFQEAELELSRMQVRAPVDGIIQKLLVTPGQKKILMADNPESATVALLFQPENMQARIDVPLSEASLLKRGQAVLLESEFLPDMELRGYIQRIVGEADLQRNTLQVKVRIDDPPAGLRPEILCRAKFLDTMVTQEDVPSTGSDLSKTTNSIGDLRILVPSSAVTGESGRTATVWAVDTGGRRVERREIALTGEDRDGFAVVLNGLRPGDRVVVSPPGDLKDGQRIKF